MTLPNLKLSNLNITGASLAGVFTSFYIKELSLCFDVANGPEKIIPAKNILITHGHQDHCGGLPYILSQKTMTSQPSPKIYIPPGLQAPLNEIIEIWQKIEGHKYTYQLIETSPNQEYNLKGNYFFKTLPTFHRVPSTGYTVFTKKKKLKPNYLNASKEEILAAKKQGLEINDYNSIPLITFTGDTTIDFLAKAKTDSAAYSSKYLFIECSFLDEKRTIEEAYQWGHIHLDQLIPYFDIITSEKIILIHLSKRYSSTMALSILQKKVPKKHHDRIILFAQDCIELKS